MVAQCMTMNLRIFVEVVMRRRALLRTLAVATPAATLTGGGTVAAAGQSTGSQHSTGPARAPVRTTEADWKPVADVLGRTGALSDSTVYRVGFPRRDLTVTSYGVTVKAGLSFGSYAAFARYRDHRVMAMGDLVLTQPELQHVTDTLHAHGLNQTSLHKHLLSHTPDVWWTHFPAIGDPVLIATGIRAALDATATPPPAPATSPWWSCTTTPSTTTPAFSTCTSGPSTTVPNWPERSRRRAMSPACTRPEPHSRRRFPDEHRRR